MEKQRLSSYKNVRKIVVLIIVLSLVSLAYLLLGPENQEEKQLVYEAYVSEFQKNEERILQIYPMLKADDLDPSIAFVEKNCIPLSKRNLLIADSLQLMNVNDSLNRQAGLLRDYSRLRIEYFETLHKALQDTTSNYDQALEQLDSEITGLLRQIQGEN